MYIRYLQKVQRRFRLFTTCQREKKSNTWIFQENKMVSEIKPSLIVIMSWICLPNHYTEVTPVAFTQEKRYRREERIWISLHQYFGYTPTQSIKNIFFEKKVSVYQSCLFLNNCKNSHICWKKKSVRQLDTKYVACWGISFLTDVNKQSTHKYLSIFNV